MNRHLSDGNLRAALDGELAEPELRHLKTCQNCQRRREQIRLQVQPAAEALSFLASPAQEPAPAARSALKIFHNRNTIRKENPMLKRIFASPILRIGLALVLILAVVLSIPATRALADRVASPVPRPAGGSGAGGLHRHAATDRQQYTRKTGQRTDLRLGDQRTETGCTGALPRTQTRPANWPVLPCACHRVQPPRASA